MRKLSTRGGALVVRSSGTARIAYEPTAINNPSLGATKLLYEPEGEIYELTLDLQAVPVGMAKGYVLLKSNLGVAITEDLIGPFTPTVALKPAGTSEGLIVAPRVKAYFIAVNAAGDWGRPKRIPIELKEPDVEPEEPDVTLTTPPSLDDDPQTAGDPISYTPGVYVGINNTVPPTVRTYRLQDSANGSTGWLDIATDSPGQWPDTTRAFGRLVEDVTGKGIVGTLSTNSNVIDLEEMPEIDVLLEPAIVFGPTEVAYDNATGTDWVRPTIASDANQPAGTFGVDWWYGWSSDTQVPPRLNQIEGTAAASTFSSGAYRLQMADPAKRGNPANQTPRADFSVYPLTLGSGVISGSPHESLQVRYETPTQVGPFCPKQHMPDPVEPVVSLTTPPALTGASQTEGGAVAYTPGVYVGQSNVWTPTVITYRLEDSANGTTGWATIADNNPTTWPTARAYGRLVESVTGNGLTAPLVTASAAITINDAVILPPPVPVVTFGDSEVAYDNAGIDYARPTITAFTNAPSGTFGTDWWVEWTRNSTDTPPSNQIEATAEAAVLASGVYRLQMTDPAKRGNPDTQTPPTDFSVWPVSDEGIVSGGSQSTPTVRLRYATPTQVGAFTSPLTIANVDRGTDLIVTSLADWTAMPIRNSNLKAGGIAGGSGWQFLRSYASTPADPELMVMTMDQNTLWWSENFGGTVKTPRVRGAWGCFNGDSVWIDPTNASHWLFSYLSGVGDDNDDTTLSGIYRTTDRGKNARQVLSREVISAQSTGARANRNAIAHDPYTGQSNADNRHIYFVRSKRGAGKTISYCQLHRSTDNGATWSDRGPQLLAGTYADGLGGPFGLHFVPAGWRKNSGNGNGTVTLIAATNDAVDGTYTLTCLTAGATGTFRVNNPAGTNIGTATVGTTFTANGFTCRVNDGSADWAVGAVIKVWPRGMLLMRGKKGLWESEDKGLTAGGWVPCMGANKIPTGSQIWEVQVIDANTWWASTDTGTGAGLYKTTDGGVTYDRNNGGITLANGDSGGTMSGKDIRYFKVSPHDPNVIIALERGRDRLLHTVNGGGAWKEMAKTNYPGQNNDKMGDSDGAAVALWHITDPTLCYLQRNLVLGVVQNANSYANASNDPSGSLFEGVHFRDVAWHPHDPKKFTIICQDRAASYTADGGLSFEGMTLTKNNPNGRAILDAAGRPAGAEMQGKSGFMTPGGRLIAVAGDNGGAGALFFGDNLAAGEKFDLYIPMTTQTLGYVTSDYQHPGMLDPNDQTRGFIADMRITNVDAGSPANVGVARMASGYVFVGLASEVKDDLTGTNAWEKISGTGNGTVSGISVTSAAAKGQYTLTCLTGGATGTFRVENHLGVNIGTATVGTPFSAAGISFTINDGSTDFTTGAVLRVTPYSTVIFGTPSSNNAAGRQVHRSTNGGTGWTAFRTASSDFKDAGGTAGAISADPNNATRVYAGISNSRIARLTSGAEVVIFDARDSDRLEYMKLEVEGYSVNGTLRTHPDLKIWSLLVDPFDSNIITATFKSHNLTEAVWQTRSAHGSWEKESGTGNGTVTNISVNASSAAYGWWTATMTSTGATAAFTVRNPSGTVVGSAGAVGTPWTGGNISFTINDGSTDWASGAVVRIHPYPIWEGKGAELISAPGKIFQSPLTGNVFHAGSHGPYILKNPDEVVAFTAGTAEVLPGETLVKGGVTAVIKSVVKTSGLWTSASPASGFVSIGYRSGGDFSSGAATSKAGTITKGAITLSGKQTGYNTDYGITNGNDLHKIQSDYLAGAV